MAILEAIDFVTENNINKFYCENCDYNGKKKSDFDKHLMTRKHKLATNATLKSPQNIWSCLCGKSFKHSSSLYRHKKKCIKKEDNKCLDCSENLLETFTNMLSKDMIMEIIKENGEIKELICKQSEKIEEQHKQITEMLPKLNAITNINNINNTANIKQKFNINIFLNEKCKDALNMDEFISKIEVTLQQLDITKNKGLAEGLSNVLIENMNKLSLYERPMHCTDIKRETLYIKDNDAWEKDIDKTKIKKAIKTTSNKQYKSLQQWMKENPDFKENDLKKDYFVHAISNIGKDTKTIDEKVIRKICSNINLKESLDE
tara:strand:+ start:1359 stop:2309 length:951 start_codon:yes stop_codon:yes gene_type:complete